jgi:hypothetical protein
MPSKDRWRKGFSFAREDEEFITNYLNERDKEKYIREADYIVAVLKSGITVFKEESYIDPEDIVQLCSRKVLSIIGGVPTCNQRVYPFGLKRQEYFIYKKGHPLEGKIMSYDDIKRVCDNCTKGFTEDDRIEEIKKMVQRDKITVYSCINPDAMTTDQTTYKNAKLVCPKERKSVRVDRTCLKTECASLHIGLLGLAPIDMDAEDEGI